MSHYRYLLDCNIISDFVANPEGEIARRILRVGEARVCTSIIVACELRYGTAKKASPRLTERIEAALSVLPVLPFAPDADRQYGDLRTLLERKGQPIGPNDLLIAAHALSLDLILVTANEKEFSRVPKLKTQNWLRA